VLLLWDIDGTLLLRAYKEHRDALHETVRIVYGTEIPDGHVEAAGRTDQAIVRSICLLAGVSAERIDDGLPEVRRVMCEEYARRCPPSLADHVAPGVPEALATLAGEERHTFSLVTGNLEPIARLKLARAGLGSYFPAGQGGFGSDHEDRTELPVIARRRAGDHPRQDTVIIGDTPRDIACARADGIRCIAVATGPFAPEALAEADVVVRSAHELLDVI
jgi:phosphoglycolate phosphatase-like HAD superfamily hydrolase